MLTFEFKGKIYQCTPTVRTIDMFRMAEKTERQGAALYLIMRYLFGTQIVDMPLSDLPAFFQEFCKVFKLYLKSPGSMT